MRGPLSILTDVIPAKVRKYVYATAELGAFGFGIYQASQGDWMQAAALVVAAITADLARANTQED